MFCVGAAGATYARHVRAAYRDCNAPSNRNDDFGFRLSQGHSAPSKKPQQERAGGTPAQSKPNIVLSSDYAQARLEPFERPQWASFVGRDKYGLFADVEAEAFVPVTFRMRWILPGQFLMGSPTTEEGRYDDEDQHIVRLTTGFWMANTPCTQELWTAIMDNNPSRFTGDNRRPVEQVSWHDTQDFLQKLNEVVAGLEVTLPTEAQWEYSCRANILESRYGELNEVAWYD